MSATRTTLWIGLLSLVLTSCEAGDKVEDDTDTGGGEADADTDTDTDADADTDAMPSSIDGTITILEIDDLAAETTCEAVLAMPGVAYTGECEGCDFAFQIDPSLVSVTGTDAPDCFDVDNISDAGMFLAHAPEWTVWWGGYYGYDYGYGDEEEGSDSSTAAWDSGVWYGDTGGWYGDTGGWYGGDTGGWYYEPYTFYDVLLYGYAYEYYGGIYWYPLLHSESYYGSFTWDGNAISAEYLRSESGTWNDYLFREFCWDETDYDYESYDTGSWYGYSGSSPVVGDQIVSGTLACGEDPEMPIADVFTTSVMEEGDTLTVTLDYSPYMNSDVWINSEDSCTTGWSDWHSEGCPEDDGYCMVASVDVDGDAAYQVVVQRSCYWDEEEEEGAPSYTLRVDSANFDCPSLTCPEPVLVTLTGDDQDAAEFTEYAQTQGWKIEGELSWD